MTARQPIILVEDSDDDAELTTMAFIEAKVANPVVRLRDGVEALDYLFCRGRWATRDDSEAPAVVLLDLKLPRLGGLEVLAALRAAERTRHLPVVVLTSSAEDADRLAAYDHHVNSYVRKPVDYAEFVMATRNLGMYWMLLNLPPAGEVDVSAAARGIRILLIEDNPDDEELVIAEVRRGGYDVAYERVEAAAAMRAALARGPWDVVLSDFAMPSFSAPAALELLRAAGLDTPFIIVSGTVGEETAVGAMRSGASDYVLKNSLARLCPAIERELRDSERRAEQRRMHEQLLISDRMASVGTLAAGVAHEINNPLAAICTNLELAAETVDALAREPGLGARLDEVVEELRDARDAAERVRQIIRDLKIFSRAPDEERRGPVQVQRVLESSLRMAWNEIRHRARLVKEYGDTPPVDANEARLGQVFLNIIVNAAQAIPEGDAEHNVIRVITAVEPSGRILIEVRDTGAGITPENLPRVFDAFFTTKAIGVGTGLGLSICHRIVRGLGGEIEVESGRGKGTTVRVLLPASSAAAHEPLPARSISRPPRRGRLLIVDDEVMFAKALARSLAPEHDVELTASAGEALERLRGGERFDVIICDLMMPQMTGMDLHAELARMEPDLAARIVFVTGGAFTAGARAFLDAVPNQRIEKPFDAQQLRAVLNDRLR